MCLCKTYSTTTQRAANRLVPVRCVDRLDAASGRRARQLSVCQTDLSTRPLQQRLDCTPLPIQEVSALSLLILQMNGGINILPDEIIAEVLTHLPAESLLRCAGVCKTWNRYWSLCFHCIDSLKQDCRYRNGTDMGQARIKSFSELFRRISSFLCFILHSLSHQAVPHWFELSPCYCTLRGFDSASCHRKVVC